MNYPARGKMSEDGKYYTHTDGSVHERVFTGMCACLGCSFIHSNAKEPIPCKLCGQDIWKLLSKQTYVQTAEEREACDVMRAGIVRCSLNGTGFEGCKSVIAPCYLLTARTCPLRVYLFNHHQADAWEVKP